MREERGKRGVVYFLFFVLVGAFPAYASFWITDFDLTVSRSGWSESKHFSYSSSTDVTLILPLTGYEEIRDFGVFYTAPTGSTVRLYGGLKADDDGVNFSYDWWFMADGLGLDEDILGGTGDLTIRMENTSFDLASIGWISYDKLQFSPDVSHIYYQGTVEDTEWRHVKIPGYRIDQKPSPDDSYTPFSRSPVDPFITVRPNESSYGYDPLDPRYGQAYQISATRLGDINIVSLELPDIFVPDTDIQLVHFGTGFYAKDIVVPEPASIVMLLGSLGYLLKRRY